MLQATGVVGLGQALPPGVARSQRRCSASPQPSGNPLATPLVLEQTSDQLPDAEAAELDDQDDQQTASAMQTGKHLAKFDCVHILPSSSMHYKSTESVSDAICNLVDPVIAKQSACHATTLTQHKHAYVSLMP